MDYQVDLDIFRGPLDLLLFLVKRNEVDICDIPIAKITGQFLEYLRVLEIIDVERAGDFLVMAATLMEIKSRMLLPRPEESTPADEDPRQELVRQLVEYKKFKDAAALLESQAEQQLARIPRHGEPAPTTDPAAVPVQAVELWDLVSAFGRLMRETLALEPKQIVVDETPLHLHMDAILGRLETEHRILFASLFTPPHTRGRLVGIFLGMLELMKQRRIVAEQAEPFTAIWISRVRADAECRPRSTLG